MYIFFGKSLSTRDAPLDFQGGWWEVFQKKKITLAMRRKKKSPLSPGDFVFEIFRKKKIIAKVMKKKFHPMRRKRISTLTKLPTPPWKSKVRP